MTSGSEHSICATASRPVRSDAMTSMSGSASTQRANRLRTTTASSTIMTRIAAIDLLEARDQRKRHGLGLLRAGTEHQHRDLVVAGGFLGGIAAGRMRRGGLRGAAERLGDA
jgi:hypothetical protein